MKKTKPKFFLPGTNVDDDDDRVMTKTSVYDDVTSVYDIHDVYMMMIMMMTVVRAKTKKKKKSENQKVFFVFLIFFHQFRPKEKKKLKKRKGVVSFLAAFSSSSLLFSFSPVSPIFLSSGVSLSFSRKTPTKKPFFSVQEKNKRRKKLPEM